MKNPLKTEPKVLAWEELVKSAGCAIDGFTPLQTVKKKNGELLFALLDAKVRSPDGDRLPNIVFIRGDACLIVTLAQNRDTGEERFLMIRQWRIGNGSLSLEFPAGMLDADVNDPQGVAAREFTEETGIGVTATELFPLYDKKLFSSAGASDEGIYYYGCIKNLDDATWRTLDGRTGGNPAEGERISVTLVSRKEAENEATSLQVLLGFYLFEEHRKKSQPG
jgi:8-oxo-dGTP pyrophosphatase MutT (NUDIX family)